MRIAFNHFWTFLLKIFGAKRLVKSVKVLPAIIKSINLIQKYPHIIESHACILKIFATTKTLSINVLTSFGIYSTPKLAKQVLLLFNAFKAIQWVPISEYSPRFITYVSYFIISGRLSLE